MAGFNFKQYFNETVPISAFDSIKDRLRGTARELQPNTFGIEIEFKYNEDWDRDGDEFDMDAAWEGFYSSGSYDSPQRVEDWEENNPEPEKPEWDDDDKVANYYSARMFDELADIGEIANVFYGFPGWIDAQPRQPGNYDIKISMDRFHRSMLRVIKGVGNERNLIWDNWRLPIPENEEKWQENKEKRKEYLHDFWKRMGEKDPELVAHERIRKLREDSFKVMELVDRYHDERIEKLTEEDWEEAVDDFFEQEHEEWQRERDGVESEWDDWENGGESEAFGSWFDYNSDDYRQRGDLQSKMRNVQARMQRIGINANVLPRGRKGGKGWNIFEDEGDVIEISSDILTPNDFPLVRKFLAIIRDVAGDLSDESLANDTGAHVHVGTPAQTDAFDLVSIVWMLDEDTILKYAGREEDDIESYANRKNEFFDNLYMQMFQGSYARAGAKKSITMTNTEFWRHLESNFNRYYGVNAIQAFKKQKTVELRFLSSQIIQDPERYFNFIQYFMSLPQLAQRKKELLIRTENNEYRIVRQPGAKVTILDDLSRVKQSNLPVAQLKTPEEPVDPTKRKQDLMSKYGDLIQKQKQQRQSQTQDQAAVQKDQQNQSPGGV